MSISVIITCFNEGDFIESAVRSVLNQSRQDLIVDIIIHDDGSNEHTLGALRAVSLLDDRIKVIFGNRNGVSKGRNLAVKSARADWLAFLDGDDLWAKNKLEQQWAMHLKHPTAGFVYAGLEYFENDNIDDRRVAKVYDLTSSRDTATDYFLKDGPITSTILCRKALFNNIGGYDETLSVFEDTEFYARVAMKSAMICVLEPLVQKRNHGSSVTGSRKDLMAHHAKVAYLIAAQNPRLYPLIPSRLADRARKLGNVAIAAGRKKEALSFYRISISFNPTSPKAAVPYLLVRLGLPVAKMRSFAISLRRR